MSNVKSNIPHDANVTVLSSDTEIIFGDELDVHRAFEKSERISLYERCMFVFMNPDVKQIFNHRNKTIFDIGVYTECLDDDLPQETKIKGKFR